MINYDSIISAYNDKPTLMEWLKKVEEALKGASATSFSVNKKGTATISFQINFDDGTSLESGDIVLQQGESVASAAIVNGHLVLTLTNGDELDAGDLGAVSGFSIDGSQHLIVTYQDGTTNDLGAIFNGNVNISGDLSVTGDLDVDGAIQGKPIIEKMTGYNSSSTTALLDEEGRYVSVVKNGNKITFVMSGKVTIDSNTVYTLENFVIPAAVGAKLFPNIEENRILLNDVIVTASRTGQRYTFGAFATKWSNTSLSFHICKLGLPPVAYVDGTYIVRLEATFLLSPNMREPS